MLSPVLGHLWVEMVFPCFILHSPDYLEYCWYLFTRLWTILRPWSPSSSVNPPATNFTNFDTELPFFFLRICICLPYVMANNLQQLYMPPRFSPREWCAFYQPAMQNYHVLRGQLWQSFPLVFCVLLREAFPTAAYGKHFSLSKDNGYQGNNGEKSLGWNFRWNGKMNTCFLYLTTFLLQFEP